MKSRMMKGTDWVSTLIPVFIVPVILVITVYIFGVFEPVAYETFEVPTSTSVNVTTNNTWANIPCTYMVEDEGVVVKNNSVVVPASNYTIDYDNHRIKKINGDDNMTTWYVYYTCYDTGYEQANKVATSSYNAFNLASILPIIIIAMAVVGVIVGGFIIGRR